MEDIYHVEARLGGITLELELDSRLAPNVVNRLIGLLPNEFDTHIAKVAGRQILLPVPFISDSDPLTDIIRGGPGQIIYYAPRQFVEIVCGPILEQSASAIVLGKVTNPELLLPAYAFIEKSQGKSIVWAHLQLGGQPQEPSHLSTDMLTSDQAVASLNEAVWSGMPVEIARLPRLSGSMQPLGPLMYIESDLRKLSEFLWLLRSDIGPDAGTAATLLDGTAEQLSSFYSLNRIADTLSAAADLIRNSPHGVGPKLDEVILLVGRLSHWVDLLIPWAALNEEFALGTAPGGHV